jgi:hypothetical protein
MVLLDGVAGVVAANCCSEISSSSRRDEARNERERVGESGMTSDGGGAEKTGAGGAGAGTGAGAGAGAETAATSDGALSSRLLLADAGAAELSSIGATPPISLKWWSVCVLVVDFGSMSSDPCGAW